MDAFVSKVPDKKGDEPYGVTGRGDAGEECEARRAGDSREEDDAREEKCLLRDGTPT